MKRLLLGLALWAGLVSPAIPQQTKAQLNAYNNANITSNGRGSITGPILNTFNGNFISSVCTILDAANCPISALGNYTQPWTGAVPLPLNSVLSRTINGEDFGIRQGGSTDDTRTATISSGSNLATVSAVGDFQVGDDVQILGAGATYSAGSPSGLSITQQGPLAPGAVTCTVYVSVDDGNGGLSAAVSASTATAIAAPNTANPLYITYTPPDSSLPGAVWLSCPSGAPASETYELAAQPLIVASMTAGSGYTNGGYDWTATGGGCTTEPQGWIAVGGPGETSGHIATDLGGVTLNFPGVHCTSAPSVAVPAGAGAGSSGAITLALTAQFQYAGKAPNWRPYYVPSTHNASSQNDWLVATIGAINGNVLTLCTPGTGVNGIACTAKNASNLASSQSIRHSWAREIQAALTAANPAGAVRAGISNVELPCGVFEVESTLTIPKQYVGLSGGGGSAAPASYCTEILAAGIGPTIYTAQQQSVIQGIFLAGDNKQSGYAIDGNVASQMFVQWTRFNRNPGQVRDLGFNNAYVYNTPQCNDGWGYGYSDYDFESVRSSAALQLHLFNTYCNDSNVSPSGTTGITVHNGYDINDVATTFMYDQIAISDAGGYGLLFDNSSGRSYSSSSGVTGNQFVQGAFNAEFSHLDEILVNDCRACSLFVLANGSTTGHELEVAAMPHRSVVTLEGMQITGGKLDSAWLAGVLFSGGEANSISGTAISANSQASHGTYAGVECAATTHSCILTGDFFGSEGSPAYQLAPVQVDAGATGVAIESNKFAANTGTASAPVWSGNVYNFPITGVALGGLTGTVNKAQNSTDVTIRCNVGPINDCTPTIGGSAVPLILPSSGSMGDNGALTLTTALDQTYPNAWFYMPLHAISASSAAGMYFGQCSSTTACTLFNNYRPISGTCNYDQPSIPASPTPFVTTGPGAYTQTTGSNINLYCVTVPPYQLGPNEGLTIDAGLSYLNSSTAKTWGPTLGTSFGSGSATTTQNWRGVAGIRNMGVENAQNNLTVSLTTGGLGTTASTKTLGSADMTDAQTLSYACQLAAADTDYCVLHSVAVQLIPGIN